MNIMIIGGTSGIGWALAEHYLRDGHNVMVCGRDLQRLTSDHHYPMLSCTQLDIADNVALAKAIEVFAEESLDLLIVSAGFYFNDRHQTLDAATTLRMLQTNVSGLNTAFELAAEHMLSKKNGHLVAISSVAGLLKDYPGASLYSACKRSVLSLCETYRIALAPFSIAVTAIVPGYVDTEKLRQLNDGDASHKPFILTEEKAVEYIVDAIHRRLAISIFPWQMRWLIKLFNYLPSQLLRLRK
ncbi:SDR family NAD(P)-dependent oxidoreductase [Solimicrobium silvestre]|uniref:Short-chain dehydrogenase of various substrate specificity n=1 Tax=Solimicrobium silvestre TaxID=2099400 RepID=A0A2S9H109_9BURK|nr:SDR family NAD(P)-dependent oxidoreductase [Solimicrobium silvestre]PRC93672.1 Short-chain dehydrogenase of various substrate specificity [Solimicrobium silvestre]